LRTSAAHTGELRTATGNVSRKAAETPAAAGCAAGYTTSAVEALTSKGPNMPALSACQFCAAQREKMV